MAQQRITIESALNTLLARFQAMSPGIVGSAIVNSDGFIVAAQLPQHIDELRIAGIGAAMVAIGEQISEELQHGGLERTFIDSQEGYIVATSLGPELALLAIAQREVKPGLIFLYIARLTEEIQKVLW
jgi:hypothetical protein